MIYFTLPCLTSFVFVTIVLKLLCGEFLFWKFDLHQSNISNIVNISFDQYLLLHNFDFAD